MNSKIPQHFGRYVIQKEVDRGSMGVLYHAEDPASGRLVVLKALSPASCFQDVGFRERFYREAEAAGRLAHSGIVAILEVAENPETRTPYFVMEPVSGDTLDDVLAGAGGKFPAQEALRLAGEVAAALEYAHEQGVIHGDLTPESIVVSEDGHAKITGFGVARLNMFKVTTQGQMFCTPAYMAPEVLKGNEVDGRCDLFSLGAILYTLLTGSRPFQSSSKQTDKGPIPASSLNEGVCAEVDSIIARALEKDPAKRYQRASEVALDIQDVQEGRIPRSLHNPPAVAHAPMPEPASAQAPVSDPAPVAKVETSVSEVKSEAGSQETKAAAVPELQSFKVHETKVAVVPEAKQSPVHESKSAIVPEAKQSPVASATSTMATHAAVATPAPSASRAASATTPAPTRQTQTSAPQAKPVVAVAPKAKPAPVHSTTPAAVTPTVSKTSLPKPARFQSSFIAQGSKLVHDARVLIALGVALVLVSGALVMRQRRVTEASGLDLSRPVVNTAENVGAPATSTSDAPDSSSASSDASSKVKRSKPVAKSKRRAQHSSAQEVVATNTVPEQPAPKLVVVDVPAKPIVTAPVLMSSLNVAVSHRFKTAVMYLFVDGNPAGQFDLQGDQSRRLLVMKKVRGESEHAIQVPVGSHRISVRVQSEEKAYDQSADTVHSFTQGAESKLAVKFDNRGNIALTFQ